MPSIVPSHSRVRVFPCSLPVYSKFPHVQYVNWQFFSFHRIFLRLKMFMRATSLYYNCLGFDMQRIEHSWFLHMGETFVCQLVEWVGILLCGEGAGIRLQKLLWFDLAEVKRKMICLCHRVCVIFSHNFQHSNGGHTGKCRPLQAVFNYYFRNQINPPSFHWAHLGVYINFFWSIAASDCLLLNLEYWMLFSVKCTSFFQNISLPRMKLQVQ